MKRFTAASVAAATALSLVAAPAQAQTWDEYKDLATGIEAIDLLARFGDKGTGAMPKTDGAVEMAFGSVAQGSSGEQAYNATQAGWALTWIAVSAASLGIIAFAAKQAGVLPANIAAALPF